MSLSSISRGSKRFVPVIERMIRHSIFCKSRHPHCSRIRIAKRMLSSSVTMLQSGTTTEGYTVLMQGQHSMDQFGSVKVHGSAHIEITPNLDAKDYNKGQAVVHYCVCSNESPDHQHQSPTHPQYNQERKLLSFDCNVDNQRSPTKYILKLPIKADVDLQMCGESDIRIRSMESGAISIQNDASLCHLKDNKCAKVEVNNGSGDIRCEGVLQGQVNLTTTHTGHIVTDRLQGSVISLCTEAGDIDIKSVYAEKTDITTLRGNVHIKNCHQKTKVDINEEGNLKIDSLDGNLLAFIVKGNSDVYISRQERVLIRTREGNINLRVPADHVASVDLHGDKVTVHEDIHLSEINEQIENGKTKLTGEMNGNEDEIPSSINQKGNYHVLHAETNKGDITLQCQDWFSSLNLTSAVRE